MDPFNRDLADHLSGFVTRNRLAQFKRVLGNRTRYITLVLEDIYQSQNASAVLRTCECLGIQDVHIVEQRNVYEVDRDVALGSNRWLSLHYHSDGSDNITGTVQDLKKQGYRIVATSPHKRGSTPENLDLDRGKVALMFGTELDGLTPGALALADELIRIPMVGFTESYNISVSAAVILYTLRNRLERSGLEWKLSEEEQTMLLLEWLRTSIKMSKQIETQYRKDNRPTF
jgi:tRNA (guanosine-2'-O-)-methyltransferase